MPTAPANTTGGELFYSDSGAVEGSDNYTTLVIYHGSAFTGHIFDRVLPLAQGSNIRLIILNRRDYRGSTKYTDDELADLNGGKKFFMEQRALEEAHFLQWVIDTLKIPPISADRKSGGLVVMGWSLGNSTSTSILGHPDVVPKEAYEKLIPYWRKLIIYDPPHLAFGIPTPKAPYDPLADPDLHTPAEVFENFRMWVGGYYTHPDLASADLHRLNFSKRGRNPSVDNMTAEEANDCFDPVAGARTEFPMFFPMQPVLKEQAEKALHDENLAKEILPDLQIDWLLCVESVWYCPWAKFEMEKRYNESIAEGRKARAIRFLEFPGNHFIHWDEPQLFWTHLLESINN